jgi:hypothetical protein
MIEIKLHFVVVDEVSEERNDVSATVRIQIVRGCKDISAALGEGAMNVEPFE